MRITNFCKYLIAAILCALASTAFAQKYERKSISYLDALLLTSQDIKLQPDELAYLLKSVQTHLELERFDYNPLPDSLVSEFVAETRREKHLSADRIDALLKQTILPEIDSLLQQNIQQRAAGLVSDEERMSWAMTKAKTLGITSAELEKVLNSGYIYFPVLTEVERRVGERRVIVELTGTILWYRVFLSTGKPELKLVSGLDEPSVSRGFGRTDMDFDYNGRRVSGEEYAFYAAVDNFARNMEVAARELPEFKLSGVVREVGANELSFDIGTKEGVGLDDKYLIQEVTEEGTGLREETVGLARVNAIGFTGYSERQLAEFKAQGQTPPDRQTTFSNAWVVMGHGFGEGMQAVEYPRLGLDVGIGLHSFAITFGKTDTRENRRYLINTDSKQTSAGIGLKLEALYNTARWSGVSQLYMLLEGGYGIVSFNATDFMGGDVPAATYQTIALGMVKKFSFRRAAIPLKVEFGLQSVEAKGWWSLNDKISVRNMALGLTVGTGFEWTLSPSAVLQIACDYRLFSRTSVWDLTVGHVLDVYSYGLWVDASGMNLGVTILYSPPKLSFDPMNLVRASLGI